MATIDLGKLGFVNKGTYSSSTSYEKNDLVQYTDSGILSTYLYINAAAATGQTPSTSGTVNGTYWAYYAKGAAAYSSTLTTQGDILYRDGSGEARLAAGTSGQVLQTGGSGANPSWTNVSSDFVKLATTTVTSGVSSVAFEHGTGDIDFTSGAYQYFKIFFKDVHMNSDNDRVYLYVRLSGGSYYTGSSDYREIRMQLSGGSEGNLHNDMANIRIFGGGTDTGRTDYSTMNGELTLMNFDDSNNHSSIMHHTHMSFIDSSSDDFFSIGAHMVRSAGVHDGIKFQGGSNIDRGKFSLYGIKG